jgi:hypothetical protein
VGVSAPALVLSVSIMTNQWSERMKEVRDRTARTLAAAALFFRDERSRLNKQVISIISFSSHVELNLEKSEELNLFSVHHY